MFLFSNVGAELIQKLKINKLSNHIAWAILQIAQLKPTQAKPSQALSHLHNSANIIDIFNIKSKSKDNVKTHWLSKFAKFSTQAKPDPTFIT